MCFSSSSEASISHQRELCPQLRLGLRQVPVLMSSEQSVASHSHLVGIPEAWPLRLP